MTERSATPDSMVTGKRSSTPRRESVQGRPCGTVVRLPTQLAARGCPMPCVARRVSLGCAAQHMAWRCGTAQPAPCPETGQQDSRRTEGGGCRGGRATGQGAARVPPACHWPPAATHSTCLSPPETAGRERSRPSCKHKGCGGGGGGGEGQPASGGAPVPIATWDQDRRGSGSSLARLGPTSATRELCCSPLQPLPYLRWLACNGGRGGAGLKVKSARAFCAWFPLGVLAGEPPPH